MAYQIDWTSNTRAVPEQHWATGREVKFSAIDSCIGVVGKTIGGKVIGVHLVLLDRQGNLFDDSGVQRVREIVDGGLLGRAFIIGDYRTWEDNVGTPYASLKNGLGTNVREIHARGRNIGGRMSRGVQLQYCLNGHWANV